MAREPITITLGDEEFAVRMMSLNQLEAIEGILSTSSKASTATARAIIAVALERDHADAAKRIGDMEVTLSEASTAMSAILRLGGFITQHHGSAEAPAEVPAAG